MKLEFTKELKDKWIEALESGKYTQGFGSLIITKENNSISGKTEHCCLGVLSDIHSSLDNKISNCKTRCMNPYNFIDNALGQHVRSILVDKNDRDATKAVEGEYPRDYSNVLPMTRQLKTVD